MLNVLETEFLFDRREVPHFGKPAKCEAAENENVVANMACGRHFM
ncbi:hypothetical protein OAG52_05360 [Verrucomicrobia bacterium]|nr:hypothetical protein [Verrucomicrobiota bacterium]